MPEVIFFYGPPFSGKTSYYEQHLKSSHERVSASEFYRSNPSWGLRHFILHLLKILGEGKGLVIDDENWSRKTRHSCIQSIRVKLPACKFICYEFQPKDAFECLWRREWILAQYFSSQEEDEPSHQQSCPTVDLSATEARIHMWFHHETGDHVSGLDAVEESEGWNQIKQMKTTLQSKANYKFEVPAAFLDWQGLMDHSTDDLVEALLIWKHSTLCGRVIVLATITDEVSNDKDSQDSNPGDVYKSVLKKLQAKTQALARKLEIPVFYVIIKDQKQSGSFTRSPKPGILSFLQRLHHIDLQHPRTMYIYQSKSSRATEFNQTGIKQFAAGLVCKNPNILAKCQGARISGSAHESITDFDYIVENNVRIPSAVPLFNKIISGDTEDDVDGTYLAEERWGRVLGVSYKDKLTFRRFQEEYTTNASHISAEDSKIGHRPLQSGAKRGSSTIPVKTIEPQSHQEGTIRNDGDRERKSTRILKLPSWMTPKRSKKEGETKDDVTDAVKKYGGLPSTIYCMTVTELREVAKIFLNQDEDSDASSGSFPDSPRLDDPSLIMNSAQEVEGLDQSYEDVNLVMEETDSEGETLAKERRCKASLPGDEEKNVGREDGDDRDRRKERSESGDDGEDDGVASIITDLFAGGSGRKKPPPKKKTARSPFAPSSIHWSDEESSYQPDTTCTTSRGNHQSEEKPKESKPAIQDFSFLDEIF